MTIVPLDDHREKKLFHWMTIVPLNDEITSSSIGTGHPLEVTLNFYKKNNSKTGL